jgi:hypothetical protein
MKIFKKIIESIIRPGKYYDYASESFKDSFIYALFITGISVYTYLIFLYMNINNSIIYLATNPDKARMNSIGVEQLKEILDLIIRYNLLVFLIVFVCYIIIVLVSSVFGHIILNFNHKCNIKYSGIFKMSMHILTLPMFLVVGSLITGNKFVPIEYISIIIALYFFIIAYMKGGNEE